MTSTTKRPPEMEITFQTEKGQSGVIRHDLANLTTIDGADLEFVLKKAEQELRRLDASRLFNGKLQRGR